MNKYIFNSIPVVKAGFPSPANDYLDPKLDYNALLNTQKASVFSLRVDGDSMVDAFIPNGCVLVVDRSIKPKNNSIVVGVLDGERIVKHLVKTLDGIFLLPANSKYSSIKLEEHMEFSVWGTVTHAIIDILNPRL